MKNCSSAQNVLKPNFDSKERNPTVNSHQTAAGFSTMKTTTKVQKERCPACNTLQILSLQTETQHSSRNYLAGEGIVGQKRSQELDGIFNYHHRSVLEPPNSQRYHRLELSQRQGLGHNKSVGKVIEKLWRLARSCFLADTLIHLCAVLLKSLSVPFHRLQIRKKSVSEGYDIHLV